jgi:hypothetical protein
MKSRNPLSIPILHSCFQATMCSPHPEDAACETEAELKPGVARRNQGGSTSFEASAAKERAVSRVETTLHLHSHETQSLGRGQGERHLLSCGPDGLVPNHVSNWTLDTALAGVHTTGWW